ncbi:MAG: insulinase family protein [Bacteroidetes bacterium]|nr:insulinase family protein [Bacteroidota bacterium]
MHFSIKYFLRYAFSGALLMASLAPATAQDLKAPLPVDPHIIKGKFSNGLTYYIRPNGKPEKKVELRLIVKAGSILENDDQRGLAHFMEHMNFNGTKNFQKNDLVSYLQSIGVQFGADLNAYTAFDQTVYILPIPTDNADNLEKGFQIIEDWAHNALLTDKDIDDERGVVLEESRLGKGAQMRMLDKFFPKLASGTKYAERLPIGKDEILKTFKYDKIRSFYKDWYRPDLQAVAVVGAIDSATAMKMLNKHFASLSNPANEKPRKYEQVGPRTKSEAMVLTDKEATSSSLSIFFSYNKKHDEKLIGDYRTDLVRSLVTQMINRRFEDLSKSSNPPFPFAGADFDNLIQGYEAFEVQAAFSNDGPQKALDAVAAELLRAKQYGFTNSELEIARKNMMASMEKSYNERNTTESSDYVEEYIRNFLNNEPIPGIENEYSYYKSMLPGISLNELNATAKDIMSNMNVFSLIMAPEKSDVKLPTDAELLAMTNKAFQQQVKPMEEKAVASDLETGDINQGHIVSQTVVNGLNATTYTLSNGVKVTIKPTDFKSDEILLKGVKKGGTSNYTVADKYNVNFATDLVDAMGVGKYDPTELDKITSGKTAKVSFDISDINDDITGNSSVKDFETLMKLIYLNATQPRKDDALFAAYKTKQKTMLQFMSANPQVSFFDTTIKSLYGGNPLARMIFPHAEDFEKINLDRSLEIYKNEFGTADGYNFFIVGNVDPATAIPLIEKYLGGIPAAKKEPNFKDNGVRMVTGEHTIRVKKGKEKQSMIFAGYYGDAKYSEDLSLQAKAVAEILNIKVIQDLREKMGGIYTGGFYADVRKEPYSRYAVMMQLPCGPENVDKLLAASKEEIKSLKEKGPEAADLDKVKSQWREKYRTSLKENKFWSEKLEDILFWGRDQEHIVQYEVWIDKLTPADIQKTAKMLFDGKNEFTSILFPES